MQETVACAVCGQHMKSIGWRHLKQHNLTTAEYKSLYPNHPLQSEAAIYRKSEAAKRGNKARVGVPRSTEIKDKISKAKKDKCQPAWNKGIPMSDERKQALSDTVKAKYSSGEITHWNTGNTTPDDVKAKISQTAKSQHRTFGSESILKRLHTMTQKIDDGWIPPGTRRKGIKITDPSTLLKMREARIRGREKVINESLQNIADICESEQISILSIVDGYWVTMECDICNTVFDYTRQVFRPSSNMGGVNICPCCHPKHTPTSVKEQQVLRYIQSITDLEVISGDRKVLSGKEIDVYVPDLNIGIEFNGNYWHSELVSHGAKHHILHKQQYAYSKGVRIINIFEDEWDNKQDIVKSRLRHILGIKNKIIHGRKCTIERIDSTSRNDFLKYNHIMGKDISAVRYGAFHDNELVGVMTFAPSNFVKGGTGEVYELNRFAIKKDTHVHGLASKMFKRFIADFNPDTVISYCDRRWNAGKSYQAMGFEFDHTTPPTYWYMENYTARYHRSAYMKHMISDTSNNHLTEWEIMQDRGFDRIWDCGTLKFVWNK